MKLLVCIMGYQCSGIYEAEDHLVKGYSLKKYKGYTTRDKKENESEENYHFINLLKMFDIERSQNLVGLREYKGHLYGRKISEIPNGISVCVTDYNGYKELTKIVDTLPIFIVRSMKFRFQKCNIAGKVNPEQFLERDEFDLKQFKNIMNDERIKNVRYNGNLGMKLQIDEIIFEHIKAIKDHNILRSMFIDES